MDLLNNFAWIIASILRSGELSFCCDCIFVHIHPVIPWVRKTGTLKTHLCAVQMCAENASLTFTALCTWPLKCTPGYFWWSVIRFCAQFYWQGVSICLLMFNRCFILEDQRGHCPTLNLCRVSNEINISLSIIEWGISHCTFLGLCKNGSSYKDVQKWITVRCIAPFFMYYCRSFFVNPLKG